MADEDKKVDEGQEPATEQQVEVERVGDAKKAKAEAVEALPKAEKAEAPKPEKVAKEPSKVPAASSRP
jgi:large subunit ribosomal protein L5